MESAQSGTLRSVRTLGSEHQTLARTHHSIEKETNGQQVLLHLPLVVVEKKPPKEEKEEKRAVCLLTQTCTSTHTVSQTDRQTPNKIADMK